MKRSRESFLDKLVKKLVKAKTKSSKKGKGFS